MINHVTTLLNKQKKSDFKPKDDEVSLTTLQTPACQAVCGFLQKVHEIAKESLDGANLDGFLNEIGSGFRGLLLDHLKKYQVNQAGGIMLSKYAVHVLIVSFSLVFVAGTPTLDLCNS